MTSDDSNIYISMKATNKNFGKMGFITSSTYEEAKSEFEKEGYVCK